MEKLTEGQCRRVGDLARPGSVLSVVEVPAGSVLVSRESGRGFWFEVLEPEPTSRHAWDVPRG